jgi:hypothetical protein
MAHKLAVLVYRMLKFGQEYVDKGMQYYEDKHRQQQIRLLKKRPPGLGFKSSNRTPPKFLERGGSVHRAKRG